MYILISLTSSTKQVLNLKQFLNQTKRYTLHFCVKFNLNDETPLSKAQYLNALRQMKGTKTIIIPISIYSRLHKSVLFLSQRFGAITIILGNIIGFYPKTFFESSNKFKQRLVILDDGLISVSLARLLIRENRSDKFLMATTYTTLMPNGVTLFNLRSKPDTRLAPKRIIDSKVLGVFGSPIVESEFITIAELSSSIDRVRKKLGCDKVLYIMHRREKSKFTVNHIEEILDDSKEGIKIVLDSKSLPKYWWSIMSSALVDLALEEIKGLSFNYSRINSIAQMDNRYLANMNISTTDTIFQIYNQLGFTEIV